jgi:hypothetical protein
MQGKNLINDPLVREAIYYAHRGRCFFTGRPVPKDEMTIDHLVPVAKGGENRLENYVLTTRKINLDKRDRLYSSEIERMKYIVKVAFFPRASRQLATLKGGISNCRSKGRRPTGLRCVGYKNRFWANDKGIIILTNSPLVNEDNLREILRAIEKYIEIARDNSSTFCDDAWLTQEFADQIKSLWYETESTLLKLVNKTTYYQKKSSERWGTICFSERYFAFLEMLDKEYEEFDEMTNDAEERTYDEYMKVLYKKYPPPFDPFEIPSEK